jgi:hypothetical protein
VASKSISPDAGVDDARGVRVLGDPLGRRGLDLLGLLEQLVAGLGELGEALLVELEQRAAELGVRAVEAAGGRRHPCVLTDHVQRRADRCLLGDRRGLRPPLHRHVRPRLRSIVVLDRTAHARLVHQLDEPELLEGAHVIGDRAEAGVEPTGQLVRRRLALVEHRQDADAQRMAHRLDVAGIVDVLDRCHSSTMGLRSRRPGEFSMV